MRRAVSGQADLIAISPDRTDITWSTDEEMEKAHVVWASATNCVLSSKEYAVDAAQRSPPIRIR